LIRWPSINLLLTPSVFSVGEPHAQAGDGAMAGGVGRGSGCCLVLFRLLIGNSLCV
jgi:hypothetical protein